MKKEEQKKLISKSEAELQKMLSELREKLWNLKKDLAAGKIKNIQEIHEAKGDIARIFTALEKKRSVQTAVSK